MSDLCVGGTPSASHEAVGKEASKAFDGSILVASQWYCEDPYAKPWVQYYKATGITATKCRVYYMNHVYSGDVFELKGSNDGSSWSAALCTISREGVQWDEYEFTECTYKYWRWQSTYTLNLGQYCGIRELELHLEWPHNFMGVSNANISKINGVAKANIKSVNGRY